MIKKESSMTTGWEDYKVKPLAKKEFKLINKAVKKVLDEKTPHRYRETLKWSLYALYDEIEELQDTLDLIATSVAFDDIFEKTSKAIVLVPEAKVNISSICTTIEKDNRIKLLP
jgi:galactitol-specific phosphotransferase system IIB component